MAPTGRHLQAEPTKRRRTSGSLPVQAVQSSLSWIGRVRGEPTLSGGTTGQQAVKDSDHATTKRQSHEVSWIQIGGTGGVDGPQLGLRSSRRPADGRPHRRPDWHPQNSPSTTAAQTGISAKYIDWGDLRAPDPYLSPAGAKVPPEKALPPDVGGRKKRRPEGSHETCNRLFCLTLYRRDAYGDQFPQEVRCSRVAPPLFLARPVDRQLLVPLSWLRRA